MGSLSICHVAQWVSRAPPHHTLPAFLILNGIWYLLKEFNIPYFITIISTSTTLRAAYFIRNSCVKADINLKLMDEGEVLVSSSKASEILETTEKWKK